MLLRVIGEGLIVDYGEDDRIVAIEMLDASENSFGTYHHQLREIGLVPENREQQLPPLHDADRN